MSPHSAHCDPPGHQHPQREACYLTVASPLRRPRGPRPTFQCFFSGPASHLREFTGTLTRGHSVFSPPGETGRGRGAGGAGAGGAPFSQVRRSSGRPSSLVRRPLLRGRPWTYYILTIEASVTLASRTRPSLHPQPPEMGQNRHPGVSFRQCRPQPLAPGSRPGCGPRPPLCRPGVRIRLNPAAQWVR